MTILDQLCKAFVVKKFTNYQTNCFSESMVMFIQVHSLDHTPQQWDHKQHVNCCHTFKKNDNPSFASRNDILNKNPSSQDTKYASSYVNVQRLSRCKHLNKNHTYAEIDCLESSGFAYQDDVVKAIIGYRRRWIRNW